MTTGGQPGAATNDERSPVDRVRAESFGAAAQAYDRARPSYPPRLVDDLLGMVGAAGVTDAPEVLDVGCGTGKAAVLFVARGARVLGVEVDARMAEVARSHGIEVETSAFEQWAPSGRTFDLVVSGQAWHWIDPVRGLATLARVLRRPGVFSAFWNFAILDAEPMLAIESAYRAAATTLSPRSIVRRGGPDTVPHHAETFARLGRVEAREYEWSRAYSRDGWLELLSSHSDHITLRRSERQRILLEVGAAIDRLGGTLPVRYRTHALIVTV
jgi:SAM-dependent methyltransferase